MTEGQALVINIPESPEATADMREQLTHAGWPRPIVGGLPIPWVSPADSLSTMNQARVVAAASSTICAVCGVAFDRGESAFACIKSDHVADPAKHGARPMDSATMHRRCILLATSRCPRLTALRGEGWLQVIEVEHGTAEIRIGTDNDYFSEYAPDYWRPTTLEAIRAEA
jgi:hypothetical protein